MMKFFGNIIVFLLFLANLMVCIGFLVCAYSPYISPYRHPVWSCAGLAFPIFMAGVLGFVFVWLFVRRWFMCLSLFTLLLGWGSLKVYFPLGTWEEPSGESIKLLTYNVEGFPKEEGDEEHSILKYLKESGADIICLQEFRTDGRLSLKKINKVLADYPYYKHTPLGGGSQLACYSRYPILSSRKINYKSQANGSVLYRLKMGKDTLILINNHLESNKLTGHDKEVYHDLLKSPGGEAQEGGKYLVHKLAAASPIRAAQADTLVKVLERNQARYMLLCGDFNDSPVSYAHRVVNNVLTDAYVEAGKGVGFSYNQNHFYFRIDHIFASPSFRVLQCKVDRSIRTSDHYPVWCVLEK